MNNLTTQNFLQNKKEIVPLTKDEEIIIIKSAQQGDKKAYEKLFKQWLPLIHKLIITSKRKCDIDNFYDDILQECSINFSHAVRKFNPTKNKRFSTYLYAWVRQAIEDFARNNTMRFYYPRYRHNQIVKYNNAHRNLSQQLRKEPSLEELSVYLGWDMKLVQTVQRSIFVNNTISIDYNTGTQTRIKEILEDTSHVVEKETENILLQSKIKNILDKMTKRDAYLLKCVYGLGNCEQKKLVELSKELGVSHQAIQQASKKAETKFKYWSEKYKLEEFIK